MAPGPQYPHAELLGYYDPGTAPWRELRADSIGGSDIAAILGISPWESPFSLWHRKRGTLAPPDESDAMRWGRRLEDDVVEEYHYRNPDTAIHLTGTYRHQARPWQLATPDRALTLPEDHDTLGALGILEVKTSRDGHDWGRDGTDHIPAHYRAQVLWYMDTLGVRWCDVAVLISGCDYRQYRIAYDPVEAAFLRERAEWFAQSLADDQRPPLDGAEATYQALRHLNPDIDQRTVELPGPLVDELFDAIDAARDADALRTQAYARVLDHLGDARAGTRWGQTVAIRVPGRDGKTPYLRAARSRPVPTQTPCLGGQ